MTELFFAFGIAIFLAFGIAIFAFGISIFFIVLFLPNEDE